MTGTGSLLQFFEANNVFGQLLLFIYCRTRGTRVYIKQSSAGTKSDIKKNSVEIISIIIAH